MCDAKTSLFSSIFTSTSRASMARGLQFPEDRDETTLGLAAGRFAEHTVLQHALSLGLVEADSALLEGAALAGDLIKLQWLHIEHGCRITTAVSERAAYSGSISILQWLAEVSDASRCVHTEKVLVSACRNGQIETVKFLVGKGCDCMDYQCYDRAAVGGHIALIKWMVTNHPIIHNADLYYENMMDSAAAGGSTAVMQWRRDEHQVPFSASLIKYAAENNRLAAIQYLRAGAVLGMQHCSS
jgi:Ankyrin repeats (3 copies)